MEAQFGQALVEGDLPFAHGGQALLHDGLAFVEAEAPQGDVGVDVVAVEGLEFLEGAEFLAGGGGVGLRTEHLFVGEFADDLDQDGGFAVSGFLAQAGVVAGDGAGGGDEVEVIVQEVGHFVEGDVLVEPVLDDALEVDGQAMDRRVGRKLGKRAEVLAVDALEVAFRDLAGLHSAARGGIGIGRIWSGGIGFGGGGG